MSEAVKEVKLEHLIKRVETFLKTAEDKYKIPKSEIDNIKALANFAIKTHYIETENKMKDRHKKAQETLAKKIANDKENLKMLTLID